MKDNRLPQRYVTGGKVLIAVGALFYAISFAVLIKDKLIFNDTNVDWELATQVGGLIGGLVTPIWTLIGALFIYQTLILQQNAIEKQDNQIRAQQFEGTLLHMMELHTQIKNEIILDPKDIFAWFSDDGEPSEDQSPLIGEAFLRSTKETFKIWYKEVNYLDSPTFKMNDKASANREKYLKDTPPIEDFMKRIEKKSTSFYTYYGEYFDRYFYHLESVLDLFKKAKDDEIFNLNGQHHPFIRVYKAQLTPAELFHIFYGALGKYSELKESIEEYHLLERFEENDLADSDLQSKYKHHSEVELFKNRKPKSK